MDVPDLIVVDGPNFFNAVLRALLKNEFEKMFVQQYLERWFDVDRTITASLEIAEPPPLGIVMFHSTKKLGTKEVRISGDQRVSAFWSRQGINPFCSTEAVYLPGNQEEVQTGHCEKCKEEVTLSERREKGVDTSITTYLLETSEKWQSVVIASSDGDFVPPARSLKRRGKQVFCLVDPDATTKDLVQVCTSHREVNIPFIIHDANTLQVLRKGGFIDQFVEELSPEQKQNLAIELRAERPNGDSYFEMTLGVRETSAEEAVHLLNSLQSLLTGINWTVAHDSQPSQGLNTIRVQPNSDESIRALVMGGAVRHLRVVRDAEWQDSVVAVRAHSPFHSPRARRPL